MNQIKKIIVLALCAVFVLSCSASAAAQGQDSCAIVTDVISFTNSANVESYIDLFDDKNRSLMSDYVDANGSKDFFQETSVELLGLEQLTYDEGVRATCLTEDELDGFSDIRFYLSQESVLAKAGADLVEDGVRSRVYVIGKENGEDKLIRIIGSQTDEVSTMSARALLYAPGGVTIYFTKSANRSYHGTTRATIDFTTYLKNVIPNEWYVSYYSSAPAYLEAGAMASKMYAWYYTLQPKWNFAPYYADMVDSSDDQNYLATSYSSLNSTYSSYVDAALSTISGEAIVNATGGGEENIFATYYNSGSGSYHGGTMGATKALSLAQEGYSYKNILRYFYDYCNGANGNAIVFRTHL